MESELPIADLQLPNENQGNQRNQKQYEPPAALQNNRQSPIRNQQYEQQLSTRHSSLSHSHRNATIGSTLVARRAGM
jgi:hypothetical protein